MSGYHGANPLDEQCYRAAQTSVRKNMVEQVEMVRMLAMLLEAERIARQLSRDDLSRTLARSAQFRPGKASYYKQLGLAAQSQIHKPAEPLPVVQQIIQRIDLTGQINQATPGPVLLVCESQTLAPDLDNPVEQLLFRLLGSLEAMGRQTWILRLPRRSARLCQLLLDNLPGEPAAIVSVEVSHPDSLEILGRRAPVIQLGMKSVLMRRLARVEHDTAMEAAEIAAEAAERRADQIAFIGLIRNVAGRRRIRAGDARLQSMLAMEAQNHSIALPSHLQVWADATRPLCGTSASWPG